MIGPINAFVANREFNSPELHEKLLLPFYDHYLKGQQTDYAARPKVEYFVRGADAVRSADTWPPARVRYVTCHLGAGKSGSVPSLNDGSLSRAAPSGEAAPHTLSRSGWMIGVVGWARQRDPARRVLTFGPRRSPGSNRRTDFAHALRLVRRDDMVFVKLSSRCAGARRQGAQPAACWITKGGSPACAPPTSPSGTYHRTTGRSRSARQVYRLDISLEPMAHRFKRAIASAGDRQHDSTSPTSCGRTTTRRARSGRHDPPFGAAPLTLPCR
jgi:hypothetical protein